MNRELTFAWVSESEFNELAAGQAAGQQASWSDRFARRNRPPNTIGVLSEADENLSGFSRPLALVVPEDAQRRLFGRFASLRTDLSPLSAWCHIVPEGWLDSMDDVERRADLSGFEAAWTSLAIAEAAILSGRPLDRLRVAACHATASYAVARTVALWPRLSMADAVDRFESLNKLLRGGSSSAAQLSRRFEPIWSVLVRASEASAWHERGVVSALVQLRDARLTAARRDADLEFSLIAGALERWEEHGLLAAAVSISPEGRLATFDKLVSSLRNTDSGTERRTAISFMAGYIATVAAGGAPSLGLAESISREFPEILAWAYVLGSVGEKVTWTSSFGGLGRLVSRELMRPFHIDEAPYCDFALDEALLLTDRHLSDPFVHLKVKQLRFVTVAIFPGVNVTAPMPEPAEQAPPQTLARSQVQAVSPAGMTALVDAMWPALLSKLQQEGLTGQPKSKPARNARRSQGKLPLDE